MHPSKLYISQAEIERAIGNLIYQICQSGKSYEYVVGIRNGGVHISRPIAETLGLPHKTVGISCYGDAEILHEPVVDDDFQWAPNGLLVDDLIDAGATVEAFIDKFGTSDVAVLFWKEGSIEPTYYVYKKPDQWLIFPWE